MANSQRSRGTEPANWHSRQPAGAEPSLALADRHSSPSKAVEQALQELAKLPLTEACLSGLCEMCLARQKCLCGEGWAESVLAVRSDK